MDYVECNCVNNVARNMVLKVAYKLMASLQQ